MSIATARSILTRLSSFVALRTENRRSLSTFARITSCVPVIDVGSASSSSCCCFAFSCCCSTCIARLFCVCGGCEKKGTVSIAFFLGLGCTKDSMTSSTCFFVCVRSFQGQELLFFVHSSKSGSTIEQRQCHVVATLLTSSSLTTNSVFDRKTTKGTPSVRLDKTKMHLN